MHRDAHSQNSGLSQRVDKACTLKTGAFSMRWIAILAFSTALAAGVQMALAQAAPAKAAAAQAPAPAKAAALLPDSFAGWVADKAPQTLTDALQADPAN